MAVVITWAVRISGLISISCLAALGACERAPVDWLEPQRLDSASVAAAGPHWVLALDARGGARAARPAATTMPAVPGICPGTQTAARASGGEWFAGWFSARPDSSVVLMVSRSTDGGATWTKAVAADARDAGRRGCARPGPAIAADSATGFVHLVYFLEPPDGPGVWFVHSMEHGAVWHPPVAIAFGADPAAASVASLGDTVAIAYQAPNEGDGWIGLALSSTDGHIIDRTLPAVSGRAVPAAAPRLAMRGQRIAVAWVTARGSLPMVRTGTRSSP
jgi:hypothetical protein